MPAARRQREGRAGGVGRAGRWRNACPLWATPGGDPTAARTPISKSEMLRGPRSFHSSPCAPSAMAAARGKAGKLARCELWFCNRGEGRTRVPRGHPAREAASNCRPVPWGRGVAAWQRGLRYNARRRPREQSLLAVTQRQGSSGLPQVPPRLPQQDLQLGGVKAALWEPCASLLLASPPATASLPGSFQPLMRARGASLG